MALAEIKPIKTHWNQQATTAEMRLLFDQVFDRFRSEFETLLRVPEYGTQPGSPIEVQDNGDHYSLFAKLPGVKKNEITIEVSPRAIVLTAAHAPQECVNQRWLYHERGPHRFSNYIELPDPIKTEAVEAILQDGILTLTLPKQQPTPISTMQQIPILGS